MHRESRLEVTGTRMDVSVEEMTVGPSEAGRRGHEYGVWALAAKGPMARKRRIGESFIFGCSLLYDDDFIFSCLLSAARDGEMRMEGGGSDLTWISRYVRRWSDTPSR